LLIIRAIVVISILIIFLVLPFDLFRNVLSYLVVSIINGLK